MKHLLENWRKFITEMEEPITTLRIFDFDETIAHTRSETRVTAPDGSMATLRDQKEFEEYMQSAAAEKGIDSFDPVRDLQNAGYEIDLSDFSIVQLLNTQRKHKSPVNIIIGREIPSTPSE